MPHQPLPKSMADAPTEAPLGKIADRVANPTSPDDPDKSGLLAYSQSDLHHLTVTLMDRLHHLQLQNDNLRCVIAALFHKKTPGVHYTTLQMNGRDFVIATAQQPDGSYAATIIDR